MKQSLNLALSLVWFGADCSKAEVFSRAALKWVHYAGRIVPEFKIFEEQQCWYIVRPAICRLMRKTALEEVLRRLLANWCDVLRCRWYQLKPKQDYISPSRVAARMFVELRLASFSSLPQTKIELLLWMTVYLTLLVTAGDGVYVWSKDWIYDCRSCFSAIKSIMWYRQII